MARSLRLDGYTRVSDEKGRGERLGSAEAQETAIRSWVDDNGHELLDVFYDDKTGRNADRPEFQRLIERIEGDESDGLVVAYSARLMRNTKLAHEIRDRVVDAGGTFVSVREQQIFQPDVKTTATATYLFSHFAAMDQLESDQIRERVEPSRRRAVEEKGIHVCAGAPTGYLRHPITGKLHPDEEWKSLGLGRPAFVYAPVVREMFEWAAEEDSTWVSIARRLDGKSVPTPKGGAHWLVATVRYIVTNEVYLGWASGAFGKDVVNKNGHTPLVDKQTWRAAQRKRRSYARKGTDAGGLLRGLVRCAGCGCAMTSMVTPNRSRSYRCVHAGTDACPEPTYIIQRPMEGAGRGATIGLDDYVAGKVLDWFKKEPSFEVAGPETEQLAVEAEQLWEKHEAWLQDGAVDDPKDFAIVANRLRDAAEEKDRELSDARGTAPYLPGGEARRRVLDLWPKLSIDEKRKHIQRLVRAVYVRKPRDGFSAKGANLGVRKMLDELPQLRAMREAAGVSQHELAQRAGVSQTWLSAVERGKQNPNLGNLEKVLRALGKLDLLEQLDIQKLGAEAYGEQLADRVRIVWITDAQLDISGRKLAGRPFVFPDPDPSDAGVVAA